MTVLLLTAMPAWGQEMRYTVDDELSSFTFTVTHLGMLDVVGKLSGASGFIEVDIAAGIPNKAQVSLEAATLETDSESRDETIRSDEFLDTGRYPTIGFTSTRFSAPGESALNKTASADSNGTGEGELTIAGTTKAVVFSYAIDSAEFSDGKRTITVSSAFTLSRENFQLEFGRIMDAMVGDEIAVTVVLTGVLQE